MLNHSRNWHKFDPRVARCVFIGFKFGMKGYKVLDLATQQIHITRDVTFYESNFSFRDCSLSHEPTPIASDDLLQ